MSADAKISNPFFDRPVINSPYARPARHWELDADGQPTEKIIDSRRPAKFITPIPKPKKHKDTATQEGFVFNEGKGLSSKDQQYDPDSIINAVRQQVEIELLSNVVDCLNQAADFLTPFSNLIPANTSAINSDPLSL